MRLPGRCAVLCVAFAVGAAKAEDAGAPLESTRKELRKLEGDQKAKSGPAATEGLRTDPTTFQLSEEMLLAPQVKAFEKEEKDRKKREKADKNWLVNGVEKLEQEDKDKQLPHPVTDKAGESGPDDAARPTSADPGYLLKLYDEQKKTSEAKQAETKPASAPQADPFAPFLQGWLSSSPARGQFFDEFMKKPEGGAQGVAPVGGAGRVTENRQSVGVVGPAESSRESPAAKPNPYLVEQDMPGLKALSGPAESLPSGLTPAAAPSQLVDRPVSTLLDPLPESQQPSRKPPLPAPTDDRKYFPQLNKF